MSHHSSSSPRSVGRNSSDSDLSVNTDEGYTNKNTLTRNEMSSSGSSLSNAENSSHSPPSTPKGLNGKSPPRLRSISQPVRKLSMNKQRSMSQSSNSPHIASPQTRERKSSLRVEELMSVLNRAAQKLQEQQQNLSHLNPQYKAGSNLIVFIVKYIYEFTLRQWYDGLLKPILLWILWLIIGCVYYANSDFNGNYYKGFYFAVNVGYSIGWGVLQETNQGSYFFSTIFLLIGATAISGCLAFLIESTIESMKQDPLRFTPSKSEKKGRSVARNDRDPSGGISPLHDDSLDDQDQVLVIDLDKTENRNYLSEFWRYIDRFDSKLRSHLRQRSTFVLILWLIYVLFGAIWSCWLVYRSIIFAVYLFIAMYLSVSSAGLPSKAFTSLRAPCRRADCMEYPLIRLTGCLLSLDYTLVQVRVVCSRVRHVHHMEWSDVGVPVMGMAMGSLAASIVDNNQQRKLMKAIRTKSAIIQEEIMDAMAIQSDSIQKTLNRHEFLLMTLVRIGQLDIDLIQKIYERFDELDVNGHGQVLLTDVFEQYQGQDKRDETFNPLVRGMATKSKQNGKRRSKGYRTVDECKESRPDKDHMNIVNHVINIPDDYLIVTV